MTDHTSGPLRPEQVQAIRERLAKITPGPWRVAVTAEEAEWWWGDPTPQPEAVVIKPGAGVAVCATNDDGIATYQEIANAEFIAHAPTDLAALLADREQREGEIERLREALQKLANEASGFLALADRETHGVTNMRVLQLRIDEARAALAVALKAARTPTVKALQVSAADRMTTKAAGRDPLSADVTLVPSGDDIEVWLQPEGEGIDPRQSTCSFIVGIFPTVEEAESALAAVRGITLNRGSRS